MGGVSKKDEMHDLHVAGHTLPQRKGLGGRQVGMQRMFSWRRQAGVQNRRYGNKHHILCIATQS